MTITDDLIAKIHLAMTQCNGKAGDAAKVLDMPRKKLFHYLHDHADLRNRWCTSKRNPVPPMQVETISRPPVKNPDIALAEKVAEEDRLIRRGLESMGLSDESVKLALALQTFQRKHFTRSIEMIGGGITKAFLDIMVEVEKITRELNSGDVAPQREYMLRTDRSNLYEIMGKTFDRANKASMTQAIIKHKLQNEGNNGKPSKPGFGTLVKATNVQIVQRPELPEPE